MFRDVLTFAVVMTAVAISMAVRGDGHRCAGYRCVRRFDHGTAGNLTVYPTLVERGLAANGISAKVINAGVPGNTTAAVLARFDKDVIAQTPAS